MGGDVADERPNDVPPLLGDARLLFPMRHSVRRARITDHSSWAEILYNPETYRCGHAYLRGDAPVEAHRKVPDEETPRHGRVGGRCSQTLPTSAAESSCSAVGSASLRSPSPDRRASRGVP